MKPISEVYPEDSSWSNYIPLLRSMGFSILLTVDDNEYQGDSRVLFEDGDQYGILFFGWGSCSGCDALQACESYEDLEKLRTELLDDIRWGTAEETLKYLKEHDWEGDYSWGKETRMFLRRSVAVMKAKIAETTG